MTDLEITRLCAKAMGINMSTTFYDPLHDDAQLCQLARKFPFEFEQSVIEWCNHVRRNEPFDVNHYFCTRIAEKQ